MHPPHFRDQGDRLGLLDRAAVLYSFAHVFDLHHLAGLGRLHAVTPALCMRIKASISGNKVCSLIVVLVL